MTVEHAVSRFAERAMELHNLTRKNLSEAIGCGLNSVYGILNERPVKLTQKQYFNLFALAGVIKCIK